MSAADVLLLLAELGAMLGLDLELVHLARQRCPALRLEPLPDAAGVMQRAREAALARTASGERGEKP